MYCPQCGTESSPDLKYCRSCGANLKVIGKAVTLSEAIARSDRIPGKIKEMMKNLKVERVTEEISSALDKMNREIVRGARDPTRHGLRRLGAKREKTPAERRERQIVKGTVSLFWGSGLMIFLYYLSSALVLKLPPDVVAQIPFELNPVIHVLWLLGLIPAMSGVGRIIAGLSIRPGPNKQMDLPEPERRKVDREMLAGDRYPDELNLTTPRVAPGSITEHTTNILEHAVPGRPASEIKE